MNSQPNIPSVPASTPYRGSYGFDISFQPQAKENKAATWTYSTTLRKLFVRMATMCPVRYRTNGAPPAGSVIRAMPVYMKPEHVQEVVRRCPNHATRPEFNETHKSPQHLICCEHQSALYAEDPYTGRLSVLIPYEQPQAGTDWVTYLIQFMCFSSCVGGLNRRPLQLIFTLEHNGAVLGRQAVEIRICACPGRDRRTEEKASVNHKGINSVSANRAAANRARKLRRQMNTRGAVNGKGGAGKARKSAPVASVSVAPQYESSENEEMEEESGDLLDNSETDDRLYTLTVHGRENLELLKRIRDSLELAALLPSSQRHSLVKQQRPLLSSRLLPASTSSSSARLDSSADHLSQQPPSYQLLSQQSGLSLPAYSVAAQQLLQRNAPIMSRAASQPIEARLGVACLSDVAKRGGVSSNEGGARGEGVEGNDSERENEVSSSSVGGGVYRGVYPGCGVEDDLTITSWLNGLELSRWVDSFHQRGLYQMSELQNFCLEDIQQIIDVMPERNKIWRALVEYRTAANSALQHLAEPGNVPTNLSSAGTVPNTLSSSVLDSGTVPNVMTSSSHVILHEGVYLGYSGGAAGLIQPDLQSGGLPAIIYASPGSLEGLEEYSEEVLYAHMLPGGVEGPILLQRARPGDHDYCQ